MFKFLKKLPKPLRNKYVLASLLFLLVLVFFDSYNLFFLRSVRVELNNLNQEINYLEAEVEEAQVWVDKLENDPQSVEKFARERYYMKKDNEEVYVIVEE